MGGVCLGPLRLMNNTNIDDGRRGDDYEKFKKPLLIGLPFMSTMTHLQYMHVLTFTLEATQVVPLVSRVKLKAFQWEFYVGQ